MTNLLWVLFACLTTQLSATELSAPAVTIHAVTELVPHFQSQFDKLEPGDMLLLDLDNTVFREKQLLGTDEWYDHAIHKLMESQGISRREASVRLEELNRAIKETSEMRLMEEGLPALIQSLQKRGVFVLGLTARHPKLSRTTIRHLAELGINFGLSQFPQVFVRHVPGLENQFLFSHGIAFTDGSPKGKILTFLVNHLAEQPQKIMAVDDRIHHIHSMVENMLELQIGGHVVHYLKVREEPPFDQAIAEIQQKTFENTGLLLSNEDAAQRLNCEEVLEPHKVRLAFGL